MDVLVETTIAAPPPAVARIMFEPENDPRWIGGARSSERLTPGPLAVGSRVRRRGGFLGRSFSWVTEVTGLEPGHRLDMAFVEGPMRGGVSYLIEPVPDGSRVSIRNRGRSKVSLPGMSWLVKRSVAADLKRLKAMVERAQH
ncbi:MAG TPA: SRPBCC family protein [Afifellaceae bacterium]|nr:SRPBCC family protein [Afifellaceae bacterium]